MVQKFKFLKRLKSIPWSIIRNLQGKCFRSGIELFLKVYPEVAMGPNSTDHNFFKKLSAGCRDTGSKNWKIRVFGYFCRIGVHSVILFLTRNFFWGNHIPWTNFWNKTDKKLHTVSRARAGWKNVYNRTLVVLEHELNFKK